MINYYQTKIGTLAIKAEADAITEVYLSDKKLIAENNNKVINQAYREISEYLDGKRKIFTFKINPKGTFFQKQVWGKLREISYGKTCSYKDIAIKINNPKAYRAVGMANNKNPIMIIIPCHRVVGSDGSLIGYAGGLSLKKYLLELERKYYGNF